MALTWISHDVIQDSAVTVQYSISEYTNRSINLGQDATNFTTAAANATAEQVAIDAQLAIWLAVPGRP